MGVIQPSSRFSGKYPCCTNRFIRCHRNSVIICFDSTKTDVVIVFTLLPLSFKSLLTVFISFGSIGAIKKVSWYTLSGRYDLASHCSPQKFTSEFGMPKLNTALITFYLCNNNC